MTKLQGTPFTIIAPETQPILTPKEKAQKEVKEKR